MVPVITPPPRNRPLTDRTVHVSRTMMLAEIDTLFATLPINADRNAYENAVLNENVLLKRTLSNREKTLRFLRELYALDRSDPVFAALRVLWEADPPARPLLALLNAVYRDEVLRPSTAVILASRPPSGVTKQELASAIGDAYPQRFGAKSLDKVSRNVASTWTQSGHLAGRVRKVRSPVRVTVGAAAFALLLGWLDERRGLALFDSLWAKLISADGRELDALAFAASNRDWLSYKRLGSVVEIDFAVFLRRLEEEAHG
jgi:hypothetical protein